MHNWLMALGARLVALDDEADGVAVVAAVPGCDGWAGGTWAGAGPAAWSAGAATVVPADSAPLIARTVSDADPASQIRSAARRESRVRRSLSMDGPPRRRRAPARCARPRIRRARAIGRPG